MPSHISKILFYNYNKTKYKSIVFFYFVYFGYFHKMSKDMSEINYIASCLVFSQKKHVYYGHGWIVNRNSTFKWDPSIFVE